MPDDKLDLHVRIHRHVVWSDPAKDPNEIGKDLPFISEFSVETEAKTGRAIATVQKGDGGEFAHFLREGSGKWIQFSEFSDRTVRASFGGPGEILIVARADHPRGELRLHPPHIVDPGEPQLW